MTLKDLKDSAKASALSRAFTGTATGPGRTCPRAAGVK